jgi:uncharacterized protein (TIGR02217 family)
MAFFESPRFPERIAFGAVGGPEWSTSVVVAAGGFEQRTGYWTYPTHKWDVSQGVKTQADFDAIRAHFMTLQGRLHGCRYRDWSDYSATHTDGRVIGITSKTFQLAKRYASGSQFLTRKITKPIAAGFSLSDNGAPLTLTTDYTINTATGIVTTVADRTAANLTWAGEFDVPVRYDTDKLEAQIISRNEHDGFIYSWSSIPVVELKA